MIDYDLEVQLILLNTISEFWDFSGLKINFDKTKILRLGVIKDSDEKLEIEKQIQWVWS